MTLAVLLAQVEALKHNNVVASMKLVWLTELEQRVVIEVLNTHALSTEEEAERALFTHYDAETVSTTVLLVPDPYSELYRYFLMAQIDESVREMSSYGNNIQQFNRAWMRYDNFYNRTHVPYMQVQNFRLDGGTNWTAIDPLA